MSRSGPPSTVPVASSDDGHVRVNSDLSSLRVLDSGPEAATLGELVTGEARARAMMATTSSFTLASATEPDLPLTWVNSAFTATTGYSAAEAVGQNCRFLQGPGTSTQDVAVLGEALRAGRDCTVVLLNYRKDGSAFWNQISVSPVRGIGRMITHFIGVQTDVTDWVGRGVDLEAALVAERATREREEAARNRADTSARRSQMMAEVAALLASTLDPEEVTDRLGRWAVPTLADWIVIRLTDNRETVRGSPYLRHCDGEEELLSSFRELTTDGRALTPSIADLLAGGTSVLLAPTVDAPGEAEDEVLRIRRRLGETSLVFVPLTARGRVVGTMTLVHGRSGRRFDAADLALVTELGARAGVALDNARLYSLERATAVTLQESLVPILPVIPGVTLAGAYLPVGPDVEVGGDWWDAFVLPDGATGLAIGDATGSDARAAAAMGQLRCVLRTCAWAGDGPSSVLQQMDRLVRGFDLTALATCVYGILEQPIRPGRPRRLVWSNAGHLYPILVEPSGRARLLVGLSDTPIGVPSLALREQRCESLPPGATLLLYTDGLIDTHTGDLDRDMRRMVALASGHRPQDGPRALVERLLDALPGLTDDASLLAVQV